MWSAWLHRTFSTRHLELFCTGGHSLSFCFVCTWWHDEICCDFAGIASTGRCIRFKVEDGASPQDESEYMHCDVKSLICQWELRPYRECSFMKGCILFTLEKGYPDVRRKPPTIRLLMLSPQCPYKLLMLFNSGEQISEREIHIVNGIGVW